MKTKARSKALGPGAIVSIILHLLLVVVLLHIVHPQMIFQIGRAHV